MKYEGQLVCKTIRRLSILKICIYYLQGVSVESVCKTIRRLSILKICIYYLQGVSVESVCKTIRRLSVIQICIYYLQGVSVESVCKTIRRLPILKTLSKDEPIYVVCDIQHHDTIEVLMVRVLIFHFQSYFLVQFCCFKDLITNGVDGCGVLIYKVTNGYTL